MRLLVRNYPKRKYDIYPKDFHDIIKHQVNSHIERENKEIDKY